MPTVLDPLAGKPAPADRLIDVQKLIRGTAFPIEYRAEIMGDSALQHANRLRFIVAVVIAGIGAALLLQAAFGGWGLAFAVVLSLPMALAGGVITAVPNAISLGLIRCTVIEPPFASARVRPEHTG